MSSVAAIAVLFPLLKAALLRWSPREEEANVRHIHVQSVLPKLRRHAFVLAGNRDRADELVLRCLEDYRAAPGRVHPISAKVDLFRLFHAALRRPALHSVGLPSQKREAHRTEAPAVVAEPRTETASLSGLTADQRCVLALVAVEGFDSAECADVLGLPVNRIVELLRQARQAATAKPQRQLAVCS